MFIALGGFIPAFLPGYCTIVLYQFIYICKTSSGAPSGELETGSLLTAHLLYENPQQMPNCLPVNKANTRILVNFTEDRSNRKMGVMY